MQLDSELRQRFQRLDQVVLVLESDGRLFEVHLPPNSPESSLEHLVPGSRVHVTGICVVKMAEHVGEPSSFQLELASAADAQVLQGPPWWNFERTRMLLAASCILGLCATLWVVSLRRTVGSQTKQINARLDELRDSEREYRELVDNAVDIIYSHDLTGNITTWNKGGEVLLGYTVEEAHRMNIAQLVAPEQLELARQMTAQNSRKEQRRPMNSRSSAKMVGGSSWRSAHDSSVWTRCRWE